MESTFDPNSNILYFQFNDTDMVETKYPVPGMSLFLDESGCVCGMEIDTEIISVKNPVDMDFSVYEVIDAE